MQIYGTSQLHGAQSISGPHIQRAAGTESAARPAATTDQLDISEAGRIAGEFTETSGIRQDRVQALREAILNGTYETDDKLDMALDRMLDAIA